MAKEATLQVRIDAELKEQVEQLYRDMGTSFAEAVRIFARQSVQENGMPFIIRVPAHTPQQRIGIAKGSFTAPDDIDRYNDEIEEMFLCKD